MAWLRPAPTAILAILLASPFSCPTAATEPEAPPDLSPLPNEPSDFVPKRTSWGDPDLRGTWPSEIVFDAGISLERPSRFEGRAWLTEDEFEDRLAKAKQSDSSYANELGNDGTTGLADWLQSTTFGRRTSLIRATKHLTDLILQLFGPEDRNRERQVLSAQDQELLNRLLERGETDDAEESEPEDPAGPEVGPEERDTDDGRKEGDDEA